MWYYLDGGLVTAAVTKVMIGDSNLTIEPDIICG